MPLSPSTGRSAPGISQRQAARKWSLLLGCPAYVIPTVRSNAMRSNTCFLVLGGLQVPTEYFLTCLGKHLKYSCCLYNRPTDSLDTAEANMLGAWANRSTGFKKFHVIL